ncbi:Hypothetical protein KVN_LOCUS172 [uncultured virus]|nr:Hypothetical protein KVN_LOCUS172 [uncultured virus]
MTPFIDSLLDQKINITSKAFDNSIENETEYITNRMLEIGYKPYIDNLKKACSKCNLNLIKKILNYKISPNEECFNAIFQNINYFNNYINIKHTREKIAEIIDLLKCNGYEITYDNILTAISKGYYVNNIDKLNIKFDETLMQICSKYSYYPYDYLNIKPSISCLEIECVKQGNIKNIKKLISYGLKPNIECLRNACKNPSNKQVISYLVSNHKLKPDYICLKYFALAIHNPIFTYLLENFNEISNTQFVDDENKDEKIIDITKEEKNIVQDSELTIDEIKIENNEKEIIIFPEIKSTKNKRVKYLIKEGIREILKTKSRKINFYDLRKSIIDYINKNKLYDETDKKYIKTDNILFEKLDISKNKYFNFKNLDIIIFKCFENE